MKDMPADDPMGLKLTYEQAIEIDPILTSYLNKEQFYAFRYYLLNMYDDDLEAHKQYHIMESAVAQMQRNNVKFLFAPNTFNFMQWIQRSSGEEWSYEKHERNVHDEIYNEWDFVPEENFIKIGIARGLQWDYEVMEDPVNHPTHNHCHHLSAESQKRWATEVAIPALTALL